MSLEEGRQGSKWQASRWQAEAALLRERLRRLKEEAWAGPFQVG